MDSFVVKYSYIPSFNFVKWKFSHLKTKVELERKQVARKLHALLCARDLSLTSVYGTPYGQTDDITNKQTYKLA